MRKRPEIIGGGLAIMVLRYLRESRGTSVQSEDNPFASPSRSPEAGLLEPLQKENLRLSKKHPGKMNPKP